MKPFVSFFYLFTLLLLSIGQYSKEVSLFDGYTFNGWEGDTLNTWRIEDNMIIGVLWLKMFQKIISCVHVAPTVILY